MEHLMDLWVSLMIAWPRDGYACRSNDVVALLSALGVALGVAIGYGIAKCEKPRNKYEID